jgi:hypothetical protein
MPQAIERARLRSGARTSHGAGGDADGVRRRLPEIQARVPHARSFTPIQN